MPDTVINTRGIVIAMNKIDRVPIFMELILKWGRKIIHTYIHTRLGGEKCQENESKRDK